MGMRKKLKAFLGRAFKTSKFKASVALAISRLAVLKNQRQARCSVARSDVVEFLNTGNHERALLRVEQVIKDQNMLDVFDVLEGYCHLLVERVNHIEREKVCPEELNEAASTLIFASTRCGEFPELREIRAIFTSRFGKEFAARAVELRNNCGVNPKVIQKLSTRVSSLENKMKVLKAIAADNNIDLPMEETLSETTTMDHQDSGLGKKRKQGSSSPSGVPNPGEDKTARPDEINMGEESSDSVKLIRKYRDVADAAQAAFESAAYAAAAARAAVELSRSESIDPDDPSSTRRQSGTIHEPMNSKNSLGPEHMKTEPMFEKIHPVRNHDSETEDGRSSPVNKAGMETLEPNESRGSFKRSFSDSSSDSVDDNAKGVIKQGDVVFDQSDGEDEQTSWISGGYDMDAGVKDDIMENGRRPATELEINGNSPARFAAVNRSESVEPLNINRRPISVRTRWARGR